MGQKAKYGRKGTRGNMDVSPRIIEKVKIAQGGWQQY